MKYTLTFCVIALNTIIAFPQPTMLPSNHLRAKQNATAQGHYEITASVNKTQLDPGEKFVVSVYMTGYGEIGESKIFVTSSSDEVFNNVSVKHSLGDTNNQIQWGIADLNSLTFPVTINVGHYRLNNPETKQVVDSSYYIDFDANYKDLSIYTEHRLKNAPFTFVVQTSSNAEPDSYILKFYFTYFDGFEWQGSNVEISFRINNWFQSNEVLFQIVLAIAALVGIIPGIQSIVAFFKENVQSVFVTNFPTNRDTQNTSSRKRK